jgi:hypothetical protein
VTILVAVAYGIATYVGATADDEWQRALTAEIKHSAAMVEDVRYVYGDEAPDALELAFLEARAGELPDGDAATAMQLAFHRRQAMRPTGTHAADPAYRLTEGGYDIPRRLAAVREQHPELRDVDPARFMAAGDADRRRAERIAVIGILLVAAYLLVELALWSGRRRQRRATLALHDAEDVNLVPRPWSVPSGLRVSAAVAFAAWLIVVLLPAALVFATAEADRSRALAAQRGLGTSSVLAVSGLHRSFAANSEKRALSFEIDALGRQFVAEITEDPVLARELQAQARSNAAMGRRAKPIASAMARLPERADGVDAKTVAAVGATVQDAREMVQGQIASAERASNAGRRTVLIGLALMFAAVTGTLATLAATRGRTSALMRVAALGMLAVSAAVGASGLLA